MSVYVKDFQLIVRCVPGHAEIADQMAAGGVLTDTVDITTIPYMLLKPHIRQHFRRTWQADWSTQTSYP